MRIKCPHCRHAIEVVGEPVEESVVCPSCNSQIVWSELAGELDAPTRTYRAAPTLKPGEQLEQYRIQRQLGAGAFGTVFAAHDQTLDRMVAIKVPRTSDATPEQLERFIGEARTAAQLNDPNIVSVYEVGRARGLIYIASDLIEGETLTRRMRHKEIPRGDAVKLLITLCRAIGVAHERGIIHRDLKPGNILIDEQGEPHITDFGLAKRDTPDEITMTVDGQIIGTPAYMSPEQARGERADSRSDIYSLGVVMYELLVGQRPFTGTSHLLVRQVIDGDYDWPRAVRKDIPRDIEAICNRAMARDPQERFQTAQEFAEDLQRYLSGESTLTRPLGLGARSALYLRAHQTQVALTALAICCVVLGILATRAFSPALETAPQLQVEFATLPPRADISVVPIDFGEGRLRLEDKSGVSRSKAGTASTMLGPGWYQVECTLPGFGRQTVWREVPRLTEQRREALGFRATTWEPKNSDLVKLAPIEIPQSQLAADDTVTLPCGIRLVLVQAGKFAEVRRGKFSQQYQQRLPEPGSNVSPFLLGQTEVTVGQFHSVMGYVPSGMRERLGHVIIDDELSCTNVSFLEALEFCERIGCRLPTLEEYLFVATEGGTQLTPWGDDPDSLTEWSYDTKVTRQYDQTNTTPPIFDLYSANAEWSWSLFFPADRSGRRDTWPEAMIEDAKKSRVILGGTLAIARRDPVPADWSNGPWNFATCLYHRQDLDGLGFRVARSLP